MGVADIVADDQPEISPEQSLEISLTDEPNEPNDCNIETNHESSEGLSESESEDGNPEASGLSNDESLEEEDHESLLQSFLTVSPKDDECYAHQLS